MKKYHLIFVITLLCHAIKAQHINNVFFATTEEKNAIALNIELDPSFFWGLEYNHVFELKTKKITRKINSQIGFKTYLFNYFDFHINAQSFILTPSNIRFNILTNLGLEYKYSGNTVHHASVFNGVISFMPGIYFKKWYLGTEIMLKVSIAEYFAHTDYYRKIYPNVEDGWYEPENSYLYFSLNLGLNFKKVDVNLRGGYRSTTDFKNYSPYLFPAFADLTLRYKF